MIRGAGQLSCPQARVGIGGEIYRLPYPLTIVVRHHDAMDPRAVKDAHVETDLSLRYQGVCAQDRRRGKVVALRVVDSQVGVLVAPQEALCAVVLAWYQYNPVCVAKAVDAKGLSREPALGGKGRFRQGDVGYGTGDEWVESCLGDECAGHE